NTIFLLENAVGIPEMSNQVLKVFENIIKNGQAVGEKILHIIADNLYLSKDDRLRDESFRLLHMINDNQDISDEIFDILEFERALTSSLSYDNSTISYLYVKMKEGQRLTPDGFKALSKIIDNQSILNEEILPVLVTISNSKRVIPDYLIEKLVVRFNPKRVHSQLIKILENELLLKLEQALENKLISDQ
ncbi:unnamed protein product, partial [Didymodactylos carnosus]